MKVLMVAPEPIFEPRGTPLSVVGRLKALSDMHHRVDLVTYSMGQEVVLPGLRILRILRIPGIRKVKVGPSFTKIPLDLCLFVLMIFRLSKESYDIIHTHEEAGFWGVVLSRIFRIPHIYDMHSSLPQQLENFKFTKSKILINIFKWLERWVLTCADGIITICPDLNEHVESVCPKKCSVVIENVVDYGMIFGTNDRPSEIRSMLNLEGKIVLLYTGTFEPYQGLDLLIQSASIVVKKDPSILFLMVGGHPTQVAIYQEKVRGRNLEDFFIFTGQVPPQDVNSYIQCANILLSPRNSGTNTPLKIYSYLRSGIAIVATRLLTHTQVLNDNVAVLTEPTSEAFAEGILSVASDKHLAKRIGRKAMDLAEENYSYRVYLKKLAAVIQQVTKGRT